MADDVRISSWDLRATAGTTVALEFTSTEALTSLSVFTGGTTTDVDDLTDATEHEATLSGGNLVATVDVDVPTGSSTPLRLVVDGAVQSVGRLIPSTSGTASPDNTITLTPGSFAFDLSVLGVVQANLDDQTAAEVAFTPTGTVGSTDVQAAIAEVSGDVTTITAALAAKAPLASPALTGTPTAPTPTVGDNTTKLATTAFVKTATDALSGTYVGTTGDQTVGGVKTFALPPVIPNGTATDHAASKGQVDALAADPAGFGIAYSLDPRLTAGASGLSAANVAWYSRASVGGVTISKVAIHVGTSSGNISVAVYANSGSGRSATPGGGRRATSGAVACPAGGYAEVALGASVALNRGDWFALSADNSTAAFFVSGASAVVVTSLTAGLEYAQTSGHPCPATPGSLLSRRGGFAFVGVP